MVFGEPFLRTACLAVPGAVVGPAAEEARFIHLALLGDDEIWLLKNAVLAQPRQCLAQAAPGIDHPGGPLPAKDSQHVTQAGMKTELAFRMNKGAIKIKAQNETVLGLGHG